MELKQLTDKVKLLFHKSDISDLSDKLLDTCMNHKTEYYDGFVDLVQDLTVDWLQKIFQYHEADRKEKKQDYTPISLARFIGKLTESENEKTVFDLCAGSGSLTIQKWNLNKDLQFVCYEYDKNVIPFLLFNLAVRNIDAIVIHGDALSGEIFNTYSVKKSDKYSKVQICENKAHKCDTCISNPPYNIKWELPPFAQMQPRFNDCELPPASNANYAFILTALDSIKNKASMILPCGVLSTDNKQEKVIRQYLIDKNLVESIIICPDKMFEATSIPTCIITFNKIKADTYIRMIDMRQTYDIDLREQNGQFGGASHEGRTSVKELKIFTDDQMERAIDCIRDNINIPEFSKSVSIQDVADQDYILIPSRYIDFQEKQTIHREYEDIIDDLNRVIRDKNCLKLTMNETIAKSIGIYDLFMMFKQSEETNKAMNDMLKFTGKEIEKENFISLSKCKNEIKFENNSKDQISTILMSIMQMWKQHIMYLNNEENRYLVELRDALLPDLMSGKLQL
jgi:type I restriction-modification system DNA methylase subunit